MGHLRTGLAARLALVTLALWLALAGLLVAAPARAAESSPAPRSTSGVIVRLRHDPAGLPAVAAEIDHLLAAPGIARVVGPLGLPGTYRLSVAPGQDPDAVAARLARSPEVAYAEPDRAIQAPARPAAFLSDERAPDDWAGNQVGAPRAWPLADGAGVVVAVLDSGVSRTHPALAGRLLPGWNVLAGTADDRDDAGHGTYVAGLVAAVAPGARILPVKILDQNRTGSTASFVAGIIYAVDHGARVINISASGILDSPSLEEALAYAEAHGVVVVASAGNDAGSGVSYPAAVQTVVAVGATGPDDRVAGFSTAGPWVTLAAPGVDVTSAWWSAQDGDTTTTASGTSASAPLVAGAAALVLSAAPGLGPAQVRQILTETAVDVDAPGIDARSGFGRLDAYLATRLALPPDGAAPARIVPAPDAAGPLVLAADGFQPGEPVAVWTTGADGAHRVVHGAAADASGQLAVELAPPSAFAVGTLTATAVGETSGHAAGASVAPALTAVHPAFAPIPPEPDSPTRRYFPETGHSLANGFKAFWEAHGGLAVFGYPLSEEFSVRDARSGAETVVQYFERARFEYHPDLAGTPGALTLGRLGGELAGQDFPVAPPPAARDDLRYFPETQHTLSGAFLDAWDALGGLTIVGYPISEPFEAGGHLVQYFERARFELHPDLPPGSQVLLTRLGLDSARQAGYLR